MSKVVALMSMSLDGYVADANDGVAEVFDWYFSGDVEVPTASTTSGMTFHVSAPSADHLTGLVAEVGAMLTGRRTFERRRWLGRPAPVGCASVRRHPSRTRRLATARLDRPVRHRRHRERRRSGEVGCRPEVGRGARRPHDPAVPGRRADRWIHVDLAAVLLGAGVRLFDHLANTPVVLGNPRVVAGVGVTHLRYPVRTS